MTIRRIIALTGFALMVLSAVVLLGTIPSQASRAEPTAVSAIRASDPVEPPQRLQAPVASLASAEVQLVSPPLLVDPPAHVRIPEDLIATPTPVGPASVPLPMLSNIPSTPRDGSVVYLTFDDGPDPHYTNQVLDVLARYGARATFFVLGSSVDAYPGTAQRIAAEGHALGNHTYYHEALPRLDADGVIATLAATNAAILRATGQSPGCFRPPYGSLDRATFDIVAGQGYSVAMWEVDSRDWQTNDPYAIASEVLRSTDLGERVLFHDGPSNRAATVAALDSVLSVLSGRGVQFLTLPGC